MKETFLKKWEDIGLTISISDNHFASSNYKADLWNLAFNGNANYTVDTLDFSFFHAQYLHYQKYDIGLYSKKSMSYIRVGFIVGNTSLNYRLGKSLFHTSSTGEELFLRINGEGFNTKASKKYLYANGYGAALEVNHNFIFNSKKGNRQIINFNLSNIGSIFWNNNTEHYFVDSAYNFNGVSYNNLDNYKNYKTEDLIDTLGIINGKKSRREALPIEILIQKVPDWNSSKKFQPIFGFKAILLPDYRPFLYAGAHYKPTDFMSVTSRLSWGGFGGFKLGLNANFWIKDKLYIGIGTIDLIGNISENAGYGKSINLSIHGNF